MLDSKIVNELFRECLFKEEEKIKDPTTIRGIQMYVGFNPERLNNNKDIINNLIDELPEDFDKGQSFLDMCVNKEGNQWTGSHKTMEELLILGLAIDSLEYCSDRNTWSLLPGGMPYVKRIKKEVNKYEKSSI